MFYYTKSDQAKKMLVNGWAMSRALGATMAVKDKDIANLQSVDRRMVGHPGLGLNIGEKLLGKSFSKLGPTALTWSAELYQRGGETEKAGVQIRFNEAHAAALEDLRSKLK